MFCNDDDAYIGDVFDKSKNKTIYQKVQWSNYGHQFNHFSRESLSKKKIMLFSTSKFKV